MGTRSKTIDKRGNNLHTRAVLESRRSARHKEGFGTRTPGTRIQFSDDTVYTVFADGSWRRNKKKKES